ncbi:outer membrane protein assembly factor BamA [Pelagibacterium montanilacus]|uniref:outer membrane protein assembly factor BamA n=1 Tax=Pelagibacterium montanilacus TaxID=2185280 RepID=UPI0019CF7245|nr:outer membrane protein assembly factor BamA [Pelagibacterium montanilacus]
MLKNAKLLQSASLALLMAAAAPVAGTPAWLFGSAEALAQQAGTSQVSGVRFEGNSRFSDAELTSMVDVANRRVYSEAGIQGDVQAIQIAYDQAGYNDVSVTTRLETATDGNLRVVFVVNEGERAGIAAINFTGNNAISSMQLKSVLVTKESHLLSWLFRDDLYDEDRLAVDRERIRLYYANRGYPDARVLSSVAEFDAERNAYFINFTIEEGEQYTFGDVAIETSIPGLDTNALRGGIETQANSRYSISDLEASQTELAVRATEQGYSFAEVRPRIDRDIANRRFNVTYLVDEGARVYVERINITGNSKTRDFVIRREFDFAEGDPFNRTLVTRGRSRIESLGFFESVQVTSAAGSAPDQVVLNVAVVEGSTGEYGIGGGYSTNDGFFGEISLTERNFLGRGQFLRAALGRSEVGQTFDFSFTEPRFMGLRVSAGVDAYRRVVQEGERFSYGTDTIGGRLRFGVPVANDTRFSTHVGLEQRRFYDEDSPFAPDYISDIEDDTLTKLTVGYSLDYSTVDSQTRPTEGLVANFSQEYAGLSHNFIKTEARARYYHPIWEEAGIIGSVRATGGIINDLGGEGIHPSEAFLLGPNLVRGFRQGGMGPRVSDTDDPLGVMAYAGVSAEVDFPIPLIPDSWGIRGAVWGDVGWIDGAPDAAGEGVDDIQDALKSSVGASVIWESPLGPLRGDFAHVLNQEEQDETQVFQLTLSTLF